MCRELWQHFFVLSITSNNQWWVVSLHPRPENSINFHPLQPSDSRKHLQTSMLFSFDSLNWLSRKRVGKGSCFSTNSEKVFLKPFQRALSPLNAVTLQFCFMNIVLIGSLFLSTLGQPWRSSTCFLESTSGSRLVNLLLQVAWNDQSSIEVITWIWYCSLGCLVKLSFLLMWKKKSPKKKESDFLNLPGGNSKRISAHINQ